MMIMMPAGLVRFCPTCDSRLLRDDDYVCASKTMGDAVLWDIALDEDCDAVHGEIALDNDFYILLVALALGMIYFFVGWPLCVIY
ncbi:Uncharacterized protein TCM_023347 [Theobroma cacao]|uniref:Uncharacterized protein n=1 Tax=Theobroma cacao TaxID=3641 RepID=A0A061EVA4_THECC|nr:Uncharacterized protein TCM_023347 [Theobroma cacao]